MMGSFLGAESRFRLMATSSIPDGYLPIFGTVSLLSFAGLAVALRSLVAGLKEDLVAFLIGNPKIQDFFRGLLTETVKHLATREDLAKVKAIARHAEAHVGAQPLAETGAFPKEGQP